MNDFNSNDANHVNFTESEALSSLISSTNNQILLLLNNSLNNNTMSNNELLSNSNAHSNANAMGQLLGMTATICFTLQYIPQALKNFERKSVHGFSAIGIIIKLVGAAFLMINAYLTGETLSVVLYGVFNVIQHSVFMFQFAIYKENYKYLIWLLFPILPFVIGNIVPWTIPLTNSIKPGAQILSHIPQLYLCYQLKTATGVSLQTQHLNMVGGAAGIVMCLLIIPKSTMTYFLYSNSMFQAISLYTLAIAFDQYRFCLPAAKKSHTQDLMLETFSRDEIQPMIGDNAV